MSLIVSNPNNVNPRKVEEIKSIVRTLFEEKWNVKESQVFWGTASYEGEFYYIDYIHRPDSLIPLEAGVGKLDLLPTKLWIDYNRSIIKKANIKSDCAYEFQLELNILGEDKYYFNLNF